MVQQINVKISTNICWFTINTICDVRYVFSKFLNTITRQIICTANNHIFFQQSISRMILLMLFLLYRFEHLDRVVVVKVVYPRFWQKSKPNFRFLSYT